MGKHGKLAVVYIRVSTEEQAEEALNLANQEKRCQSYCHQKNLTIVKVFIDAGESARTSARPSERPSSRTLQRGSVRCARRRSECQARRAGG